MLQTDRTFSLANVQMKRENAGLIPGDGESNVKKRFKSENSYMKICRFKIKALPLPSSKNWLRAPYGRVEAVKGHIYIKT